LNGWPCRATRNTPEAAGSAAALIAWCESGRSANPKTSPSRPWSAISGIYLLPKADGKPMTMGSQFGCLRLEDLIQVAHQRKPHPLQPASELSLPRLPKHLARVILSDRGGRGDLARGGADHGAGTSAIGRCSKPCTQLPCAAWSCRDLLAVRCKQRRAGSSMVRERQGKRDRVNPDRCARRGLGPISNLKNPGKQLASANAEALFLSDTASTVTPPIRRRRVPANMHFAGIKNPAPVICCVTPARRTVLENGAGHAFYPSFASSRESRHTSRIYNPRLNLRKLREIHDATHPAKLPSSNKRAAARNLPLR